MNGHLRKSTNENKGQPEQKFDAALELVENRNFMYSSSIEQGSLIKKPFAHLQKKTVVRHSTKISNPSKH